MTLLHTHRDGWNWLGEHKIWTLQGTYKYVKMPRNSMSLQFTALDFPPWLQLLSPKSSRVWGVWLLLVSDTAKVCRKIQNFEFERWQVPVHLSGLSRSIFLVGIYSVMRPALCLTDLELSRIGSAVSGAGITNWNEQKHCYSCRISHLRWLWLKNIPAEAMESHKSLLWKCNQPFFLKKKKKGGGRNIYIGGRTTLVFSKDFKPSVGIAGPADGLCSHLALPPSWLISPSSCFDKAPWWHGWDKGGAFSCYRRGSPQVRPLGCSWVDPLTF